MILEKTLDLLDSPCDLILSVNNCFHVQGGGLALAIREKWPEVYEEDCKSVKGDMSKLGTCFLTKIKKPENRIKYVIGLYAQYRYGADFRQIDYEAFYKCLEWIKNHIANTNLVIGIPKNIGCGLAGGDWRVIKAMIYSVFEDSPRNIIICEKTN